MAVSLTYGSLAVIVGSHALMLAADRPLTETEMKVHAWANLAAGGVLAFEVLSWSGRA